MITPEKIKIINSESSVAVFIDLENFVHLCNDEELEPDLSLILSTFPDYAIAVSCGNIQALKKIQDQNWLWESLKELKIQHDNLKNSHQKNSADMQLAVLITSTVYLHPSISTYILITGDRDFIPVANFLRAQGKYVIGVGPEYKVASEFRHSLHQYRTIPELLEEGKAKLAQPELTFEKDVDFLLHAIREVEKETSLGSLICSKFRSLFPDHPAAQPKFGFKKFCLEQAELTGRIAVSFPDKGHHERYEVREVEKAPQTAPAPQPTPMPRPTPSITQPEQRDTSSAKEMLDRYYCYFDYDMLVSGNELIEAIQKTGANTPKAGEVYEQLQAMNPCLDLNNWELFQQYCRDQAEKGKICIKQFTKDYWELELIVGKA